MIFALPPLVGAVFNGILGIYVLLCNPEGRANRVYAAFSTCLVILCCANALSFLSLDERSYIFWTKVTWISVFLGASTFVHFTLIFPKWKEVLKGTEFRWLRFVPAFIYEMDRWLVRRPKTLVGLVYLLGVIAIANHILVPERMWVERMEKMFYGYAIIYNPFPAHLPLVAITCGFAIYIGSNLFTSYINASEKERKQVKALFWGWISAFLVILTVFILATFIRHLYMFIPPILNGGLTILPTSFTAYAILRYRLLLAPALETPVVTPPKHSLEGGAGYLYTNPEKAFEIFADLVTHGTAGLCIISRDPKFIREKLHLEKTPILWLSDRSSGEEIATENIEEIVIAAEDFLKKSENSVILLEGLDYLAKRYEIKKVLRLAQNLNEAAVAHNARFLLVANQAIGRRAFVLLAREMEIIE